MWHYSAIHVTLQCCTYDTTVLYMWHYRPVHVTLQCCTWDTTVLYMGHYSAVHVALQCCKCDTTVLYMCMWHYSAMHATPNDVMWHYSAVHVTWQCCTFETTVLYMWHYHDYSAVHATVWILLDIWQVVIIFIPGTGGRQSHASDGLAQCQTQGNVTWAWSIQYI